MAKSTEVHPVFSDQNQNSTPVIHKTLEQLYDDFHPLIRKLAKDYSWDKESFNDLYQEGCIGLIEAVRTYDHTRSSLFTHVYNKVQGYMSNWCHKENRSMALSNPVTRHRYVSFSDPVIDSDDGDAMNYEDIIPATGSEINPEDCLSASYLRNTVMSGLSMLTEKQKQAIYHLFWDGYSPSEIAEEMGVSRPRVSAIIKTALNNAREHLQCAA